MICKSIKHNDQIYLTTCAETPKGTWYMNIIKNVGMDLAQSTYQPSWRGDMIKSSDVIIASTQELEGVLQIPQEFIQVCLDNDEVNVEIYYAPAPENYEELAPCHVVITPVEKVQEIKIIDHLHYIKPVDNWWNGLSDSTKESLYNLTKLKYGKSMDK